MKTNRVSLMIIMIGMVLILTNFTIAASMNQQEIDEFNKASDNQKAELLKNYMNQKFKYQGTFENLDGATLEGNMLRNPNGGTLDISKLKGIGASSVKLLSSGGFEIKRGETNSIKIEGANEVSAEGNKLWVDGMEITPSKEGNHKITKNGNSFEIEGTGDLTVNGKSVKYSAITPMTVTKNKMVIQANENGDNYVTYKNTKIKPTDGDATIYTRETDFNNAKGENKVLLDNKLKVFQTNGRMLVGPYEFNDGIAREALGALGKKGLPIYFSSDKTVTAQSRLTDVSAIGIFQKAGYGGMSQSFAARKDMWNQYKNEYFNGETFRGSAEQNAKLGSKIKSGEIPLYDKIGDSYDLLGDSAQHTIQTKPNQGGTGQTGSSGSHIRLNPITPVPVAVSGDVDKNRNNPTAKNRWDSGATVSREDLLKYYDGYIDKYGSWKYTNPKSREYAGKIPSMIYNMATDLNNHPEKYVDMSKYPNGVPQIDPAKLIALAHWETGGFTSSNALNKNNFAGITGSNGYRSFSTPEAGVKAYIQNFYNSQHYFQREKYDMKSISYTWCGNPNQIRGCSGHLNGVSGVYDQIYNS